MYSVATFVKVLLSRSDPREQDADLVRLCTGICQTDSNMPLHYDGWQHKLTWIMSIADPRVTPSYPLNVKIMSKINNSYSFIKLNAKNKSQGNFLCYKNL